MTLITHFPPKKQARTFLAGVENFDTPALDDDKNTLTLVAYMSRTKEPMNGAVGQQAFRT